MYENLNKNSIIDVASTLINEMNSYTPEQQNQLLEDWAERWNWLKDR